MIPDSLLLLANLSDNGVLCQMGRLWCEKCGGSDKERGPASRNNPFKPFKGFKKVSSDELNGLSYFERFEPPFHSEGFSPKEPRFG